MKLLIEAVRHVGKPSPVVGSGEYPVASTFLLHDIDVKSSEASRSNTIGAVSAVRQHCRKSGGMHQPGCRYLRWPCMIAVTNSRIPSARLWPSTPLHVRHSMLLRAETGRNPPAVQYCTEVVLLSGGLHGRHACMPLPPTCVLHHLLIAANVVLAIDTFLQPQHLLPLT